MMKHKIKIGLKEIELFGYHGLYEEEKQNGNNFLVDVEFSLKANGPVENLDDTVDYVAIEKIIREEFEIPTELLEVLGSRIINHIKINNPKIDSISLKIAKKAPPLSSKVNFSYVQITDLPC